MPDTVLGAYREVTQRDNNFCPCKAYVLVQEINNTINVTSKVIYALEKVQSN